MCNACRLMHIKLIFKETRVETEAPNSSEITYLSLPEQMKLRREKLNTLINDL